MAKSLISEPAFSLFSETMLDMKGMAVAGFPGVEEDNPVAHEAVKFQGHYMNSKGKTITSKAKQASAKPKLAAEYAPDPLELLIAKEEVESEMFAVSVFHVNKLIKKIKDAESVDAVSDLAAQAEGIVIAMKGAFPGEAALQKILGLGDDLAIVVGAKKGQLSKKVTAVSGILNSKKAMAIVAVAHA